MSSSTPGPTAEARPRKGSVFWLSFIAVAVAHFLSALDFTSVSTAAPTITADLHGGDDFVWVGAAYGLASAAILPFSGRLADVLGRRPVMLVAIAIFLVGSALDRKSTRLNSSHSGESRMPSSA